MTLLLMMVSLKPTLTQDLATADAFTRNPSGLRGGCARWGRQETSVRQENCGAAVRWPCQLSLLSHLPQSEEDSSTETTAKGWNRRVPPLLGL